MKQIYLMLEFTVRKIKKGKRETDVLLKSCETFLRQSEPFFVFFNPLQNLKCARQQIIELESEL